MDFKVTLVRCILLMAAFLSAPLKAQLVISEFLASNSSGLKDELLKTEDWIEIQNTGATTVSLSGWYLTDKSTNPSTWAFPAWTLNAGARLVVFASGRDMRPAQTTAGVDNAGTIASPRLATNFKIGTGAGGYLALTKAQTGGTFSVVSEIAGYPKQLPDFSFGKVLGTPTDLFADGPGVLKYLVPTSSTPSTWTQADFDTTGWIDAAHTAVGFDIDETTGVGSTSYLPYITQNLGKPVSGVPHVMWSVNTSLYARYSFTVADKAAISGLILKLRYEDGFVAWLNGVEITRANFTGTPAYNSGTAARNETLALALETIDVSSIGLPALRDGVNVLAIQGINATVASNDFLLAPILQAFVAGSSYQSMIPTPGAANSSATVPATLAFSVPSGLITGPVSVAISGQQEGQTVRYTTNGSEPTLANGTTYSVPISLTGGTTLKARLFFENTPGPLVDAQYILRGTAAQYGITPATFSSSLPILVIDSTDSTALTNTVANPARISLIDRNPATQRASLTATPAFTTQGALNVRGQSSAGLAKKGYALEFRNAYDLDKNLPVLGMPADSDWVLYASYQYDTDFMRNVMMYDFYRRTGRWAPQTRYVEVFLNPAGTSVDGADYLGVYVLMEKIKLDSNRINLNGVTPLDNSGDALTGAYIFAHDKQETGNPANELLQNGTLANWNDSAQVFIVKEPNYLEITSPQRSYLLDLIAKVDGAVGASNFINPSTGLHYRDYIARDTFIDHHMFNAFSKNVDGLRISTYFQKDRLGKIQMSSIWDFDRSMDSDTDTRDDSVTNWNSDDASSTDYFSLNGRVAEGWFHRLQQDPDYLQEWVDRYDRWRAAGVLDATAMTTFLDQKAAELTVLDNGGADTPIARNFYRWPRTIRSTATTQTNAASVIFGAGTSSELGRHKTWIQQRIAFMDTFVLAKPAYSVAPGVITSATDITIASADSTGGTLYYTTDGTDPRAAGGLAGTAAAKTYTGPIRLATSGFVTSRLRKTGLNPTSKHTDWSAPRQAYYIVGAVPATAANLVVTELMYHPSDPSAAEIAAGFLDSDQFEYIELFNSGASPINLYGAKITAGVDVDFSSATAPALLQMAAGERVLVVKNKAAFTFRHGAAAAARILGEFAGNDNLNNSGEIVTLTASDSTVILSFAYSDIGPWPAAADGLGSSLVLSNRATGADLSDAANWKAGNPGGSPGTGEVSVSFASAPSTGVAFAGQLQAEAVPAGITRSYAKTSGPAWLAISSSGALSGTPPAANAGANLFTIGLTENGKTFSQGLSLAVNTTPAFAANPVSLNATEDAAFAAQLAAIDPDAGAVLTFTKVSGPSWLSVSPSGALSGTPANAQVGVNTFAVSVSDGLQSVQATLTITVANTNDAPAFAASSVSLSATGGSPFSGQLSASDEDAGAVLSFSKQNGPSWLTVSPSGALSGTPGNADAGLNVFTVSVTDGLAAATATLNITVTASGPSFGGFAATHFTAQEQADPLVSGPAADPDGDGLPNLLEYALGLDPRQSSGSGLPAPSLSDIASDSFITLSYVRLKGAADLAFVPEFSSSPADAGFTASPFVQISLVDNGNGTETVTIRDSTPVSSSSPRFVRLRVIQN